MKSWSKKAVLGAFLIGIAGAAAVSPAENAIRAEAAAVDFLVPDSQSRYLTEEDLAGMNAQAGPSRARGFRNILKTSPGITGTSVPLRFPTRFLTAMRRQTYSF